MDRRVLIAAVTAVGAVGSLFALIFSGSFTALMVTAFIIGGTSNPLYSLLIAYTNDFLEPEDMAAASGGLIFINGMGAISGPIITGWFMGLIGPGGFWAFIAILMLLMAAYALYRTTQRAAIPVEDTAAYVGVFPAATPVALEVAQEWAIEAAEDENEETTGA